MDWILLREMLWILGGFFGITLVLHLVVSFKRTSRRQQWIEIMRPLVHLLGGDLKVDSALGIDPSISVVGNYKSRRVLAYCRLYHQRSRPVGRQIILEVALDPRHPKTNQFLGLHETIAAGTVRNSSTLRRTLPGLHKPYPVASSTWRFGSKFFIRELDDMVRLAEQCDARIEG